MNAEDKGMVGFWNIWREFWPVPKQDDIRPFQGWVIGLSSVTMKRALKNLSYDHDYAPRLNKVKAAYYHLERIRQPREAELVPCNMCQEDPGWVWTTYDPMTELPVNPDNCSTYGFATKIVCTCKSGQAVAGERGIDVSDWLPWRGRCHGTELEAQSEALFARQKAGDTSGRGMGMLGIMMPAYEDTVQWKIGQQPKVEPEFNDIPF